MLNRPLRIRDAVRVRPIAQRATVPWPKGCPGYRLVEEPAEVGTIVALTTAADLWPDADDRDVVGDVMVAAVLWDGLASQLADDAGDGMPEVATWLIPVDALELADEPDRHDASESSRLRRMLAVERCDASQAPDGWGVVWPNNSWSTGKQADAHRVRDIIGPVSWLWRARDASGTTVTGVAPTALEAMEAADAVSGPTLARVELPEADLSDDLRLHLAASRAIAATRLSIAVQLRDRAAELEAERRDSPTQRTVNARVARVLRGIADDVQAGKAVTRG